MNADRMPLYIPRAVLLMLPCPACGARRGTRCHSDRVIAHAARSRELEAAYLRGWHDRARKGER